MTTEQLHDALTLLPADLVAAADQRRSRKTPVIHWHRWAAMAACLALIVYAGGFCARMLAPKKTESAVDMEMAAAEQEAAPAEMPAAIAPAQNTVGTGSVVQDWDSPAEAAPPEREDSSDAVRLAFPPDLRMESGSQALTIAAAGYTWEVLQEDGTVMTLCADIPAPTDALERHPVLEAETEAADLIWEIPPQLVTARCWHEEDLQTEKPVEMNGTILPFCRGTHIYEITAHWENGTATYVVLVNTLR